MTASKMVLPVVAGAMGAMMLIALCETLVKTSYVAGGTDMMPSAAFVLLLVVYAVCSLGGGVASSLIAGRTTAVPAVIAGVLLTLAGAYNMAHFAHPALFSVAAVVIYLPCCYAGYMLVRRPVVS